MPTTYSLLYGQIYFTVKTLKKLLLMLLRIHGALNFFKNAALLWSGTTYLWSGYRESLHTTPTLTAFPHGAES